MGKVSSIPRDAHLHGGGSFLPDGDIYNEPRVVPNAECADGCHHTGEQTSRGDRRSHQRLMHACCWMLRFTLIVPLFHLFLHVLAYFGIMIPHPEFLAFIP